VTQVNVSGGTQFDPHVVEALLAVLAGATRPQLGSGTNLTRLR
jgi:hypothetical protein